MNSIVRIVLTFLLILNFGQSSAQPFSNSEDCLHCEEIEIEFARGPGPPPTPVPIDGGLVVLISAGAILGIIRLRKGKPDKTTNPVD